MHSTFTNVMDAAISAQQHVQERIIIMTKSPHNEMLPGGALLKALLDKAKNAGLDRYELASAIGISYPYLTALLVGNRPVSGIEINKLRKISEFLDLSFVQVLMLAEIVISTDFVAPRGASLDEVLSRAIEQMRRDEEWGRVAPSEQEWCGLSASTRLGIVLLWERMIDKQLVEKISTIQIVPPEPTGKQQKSA